MNIADRIQHLRKSKGFSQEELADKIGVSRQAVSKWESEQSTPDLEKIIVMSDFFGVTTDYILKGIEPVEDKEQKGKELASRVLYVTSTTFVFIGLFCAFGGWHKEQTMEVVWGSMIIQAVGIAGYFIGKLLSSEKAHFYVDLLNIVGIAFMPISMMTGYISILILTKGVIAPVTLTKGWIAPYPISKIHTLIFGIVFSIILVVSYLFVKKRTHSTQ